MDETLRTGDTRRAALWRKSEWYQALTLAERFPLQETAQEIYENRSAQERLASWKSMRTFQEEGLFAKRLAAEGLTEEQLLVLLGETSEQLAARSTPEQVQSWLHELEAAFTTTPSWEQALPHMESFKGQGEQLIVQLLRPLMPLLYKSMERLRTGISQLIAQHAQPILDREEVISSCFEVLIHRLLFILSRTLILELHVARLEEQLQGETEQERFLCYLDLLDKQGKIVSLLLEYPVLARALVESIKNWERMCLELLERLFLDWSELHLQFEGGGEPGSLKRILLGTGDTHRQGRSVSILEWSSGFRLVYKPKSLALDVHFGQLLDWLNSFGEFPELRVPSVVDRGEYGWSEYISVSSCHSEPEVRRFYERQGAYLAVFYILGATDFHSENIIASGEHPVPVDLECLFQAHKRAVTEQPAQTISSFVLDSVLSVGILPERSYLIDQQNGIDMSGLGGQGEQIFPLTVQMWEGVGTDQMHLEERYQTIDESDNRPKLEGREVDLLVYRDQLVGGFTVMYRLLMKQRESLLSTFLPRFANDSTRVLLRATQAYAYVLSGSFHPNLLRDALMRESFLDMLWLGTAKNEQASSTIPLEREELLQGDIPLFTSYADSCTLFSGSGRSIHKFFQQSGLQDVRERVGRLSEEDLARQCWVIDASLATFDRESQERDTIKEVRLPDIAQPVARERLMHLAREIGEELSKSALRLHDQAGWLAIQYANDEVWHLNPTGMDLYNGTPGIILFLAHLAALTGEERYRELAEYALVNLRAEIEQQLHYPELLTIGAFSGLGSPIYLFSHLGVIWQDTSFFREAEKLAGVLAQCLPRDILFDAVAGAAGAILSLLSLYDACGSATALTTAVHCGEHLLQKAVDLPEGKGWKNELGPRPLSGFAHGSAGIAWSLFRLADASNEPRFRQAANEALRYERSLFSIEQQNWLTLRQESEGPRYMKSWCHGAAGIGLSRLGMMRLLEDPEFSQEIQAALQITEKAFGGNHSLCHGGFGNLEVLLVASQTLENPYWSKQVQRIANWLVDDLEQRGWQTGLLFHMQTPAFMVGLSGIGYQLLRLAYPEQVSSVLLVDPPVL